MTSQTTRPTAGQMALAAVCLLLALGGAFLAASLTQNSPVFSLSPPSREQAAPPNVEEPPLKESQRLDLHRTFFTAWAALLLTAPAFCTFLFRRSSPSAAGYWLAFWTVGLVAFLVHFYWAVAVIFGGDWEAIKKTARVSAAVPDTVFAAWWVLDVLLAWLLRSEGWPVRAQRLLVHLFGFALFFAGAALEGELVLSRAIGWALGAAVLLSALAWAFRRLRRRGLAVAHAA